MSKPALEVDLKGLRELQARRPSRLWILLELVQNAWDADGVREVHVDLIRRSNSPLVEVFVSDDSPGGFMDLSHAYTLFARSTKVEDEAKRGMFNLGEKLVLASMSGRAVIGSTTGTIEFDLERNTRRRRTITTPRGSYFRGNLRMTREEQAEVELGLMSLIPPPGVSTFHNGRLISSREPRAELEVRRLKIMAWDEERQALVERPRKVKVNVHDLEESEDPTLYCLGLPVVPLPGNEPYHLDVQARLPVDLERCSIRPSILKLLRAALLDWIVEHDDYLTEDTVQEQWILDAMKRKDTPTETVKAFLGVRHGPKHVSANPADPEANKRAVAAGYTLIYSRDLPKEVWARARDEGLIQSSSKVTPSHRVQFGADGEDVSYPLEKWTDGMKRIVRFTGRLGTKLLNVPVHAELVNDFTGSYRACYSSGPHRVTFNVARLGKKWFEQHPHSDPVLRLLIHEFAHETVSDHLSDAFSAECISVGINHTRANAMDCLDLVDRISEKFKAVPAEAAGDLSELRRLLMYQLGQFDKEEWE